MANRMRRGGAAALLASRMSDPIEPDEDEEHLDDTDDGASDEPEPIVDEPDEPEPSIDYSHEEPSEAEEPAPEAEEPDELAALQAQLATLQGKNAELERDRDDAELSGQHAAVVGAHRQASADLDKATANYEAAAAKGDWKAAGKAQVEIARAAADVREFENAAEEIKQAIDRNRKTPRQPQREQQPAAGGDGFERAIAKMSDASKQWCRAHKADLASDPLRGELAKAAHIIAVSHGIKVDTPEYFAHLDKQMGYEPVTKKPNGSAARPVGKPRVAAPSGGRAAPRGDVGEIRLSAAEVDMAKSLGMTNKAYAARKKELILNGKDSSRSGPRYTQNSPQVAGSGRR